MTWDEIKAKYGDEKVKFSSYYKFTFTFANGNGFMVHCGGIQDDIYRFEVVADKEYLLRALEPDWIRLNGETIYDSYQTGCER